MEHKLITGGEIYLPFARSRIKALQATGLAYASQKFEMGDASVKVRIEPGHEYIELSGGDCTLAMDSGIIDALSIAPANPARYSAGTLIEAGSVQGYNLPFANPGKLGRTNPGKGSAGQLSGIVKGGAFLKGHIPGGAPSYSQKMVNATPATLPPSKVPDPADDNLYAKKVAGAFCPASVFTGKCRLYVQAMYGLPLYEYDQKGEVVRTNLPMNVDMGVPAVHVASHVKKGSTAALGSVPLNTSCGVGLDENGKHWLFRPTLAGVDIYPLISSLCGEKMRRHLLPNSKLNATDKDHLEAYILSYCKPDVARMQRGTGDLSQSGTYSMGFGWHWNWSGNTADLVKNDTFDQGGVYAAMRSTHYRLIIRKVDLPEPPGGFGPGDTRQVWETPVAVVSGPTDWSADRVFFVLTAPDHSASTQYKVTPRYTLPIRSTAPFYAFYRKNELVVCTAQNKVIEDVPGTREASPGFALYGEYNTGILNSTVGALDGFLTDRKVTNAYTEMTFRCGSVVTPALSAAKVAGGNKYKVINKVRLGTRPSGNGSSGAASGMFDSGYPISGGPLSTNTYNQVAANGFMETGYQGQYTWDYITAATNEVNVDIATLIVPAFDAEAIFVQSQTKATVTASGTKYLMSDRLIAPQSAKNWDYETRFYATTPYLQDDPHQSVVRYAWDGGGQNDGTITATQTYDDTQVTVADQGVLICRAGQLSATFTSLSSFHNQNIEEVGDPYQTYCSASADVAISTNHITPVGLHGAAPVIPIAVGWL